MGRRGEWWEGGRVMRSKGTVQHNQMADHVLSIIIIVVLNASLNQKLDNASEFTL